MNPILSVSDSCGIKGGAGDSLSPSLSRIKNKFSTQSQFSSLKVVHVSVQHFWTFTSRFSPLKDVYGHITLNTPVLVRSLKLSKVETC